MDNPGGWVLSALPWPHFSTTAKMIALLGQKVPREERWQIYLLVPGRMFISLVGLAVAILLITGVVIWNRRRRVRHAANVRISASGRGGLFLGGPGAPPRPTPDERAAAMLSGGFTMRAARASDDEDDDGDDLPAPDGTIELYRHPETDELAAEVRGILAAIDAPPANDG